MTRTTHRTETLDAETRSEVAETIDHLNGTHGDTVLFVARHLAGDRSVEDAELADITAQALTMAITSNGESDTLEVAFPTPLTSADELSMMLMGKLTEARAADPDGEFTSIEKEMVQAETLRTHHVTVIAVQELTPQIRQLTFAGLDAVPGVGCDDFVMVIPPEEGEDHLPPDVTMQSLRDRPHDEIPPMAYYTIREWRTETQEVDVWFVLHGHDQGVAAWSARVTPGASAALWGPRRGFETTDVTTDVLMCVDETGIAAALAFAETVPPTVTVHVLCEIGAEFALPPIPDLPHLSIEWLKRDGEPGTSEVLFEAVQAMEPPTEQNRSSLLVLGGAESRCITRVRKHVRSVWGLSADQVTCVGYWRRST